MREAVKGNRDLLGSQHPDTLTVITNLGYLFKHVGKYSEAKIFLTEAVEGYRFVFSNKHPEVLRIEKTLAELDDTIRAERGSQEREGF